MPRSVLILLAHPAYHRSRASRALIEAARELPGVQVHDLYEVYPDLLIDVEHEQRLIAERDVLVFQHPLFWYSAPALMKEWIDVVLTHGFAYGKTGTALAGKAWLSAITAGGRGEAYGPAGTNRFQIEELLRPFEATAGLCGLSWQKPYVLFASHFASDHELRAAGDQYAQRIRALQHQEPVLRAVP